MVVGEPGAATSTRAVSWKRHLIKTGGKNQHHDQVFGDFLGTGKPQLAFWNQQARTLFLAEIPADPRDGASRGRSRPILTDAKPAGVPYIEGVSAFDVDADGKLDMLACDSWFKHTGGKSFKQVQFADGGGLIFAGYFKPSKYPQIVDLAGRRGGPRALVRMHRQSGERGRLEARTTCSTARWFTATAFSLATSTATGISTSSCAEMAKWREKQPQPDHPEATAWILYGDGPGQLHADRSLVKGHGWHEARVADLDGDGDLDLLNKPYTWEAPRVDVWLNGQK